jgi:hypothetical protein
MSVPLSQVRAVLFALGLTGVSLAALAQASEEAKMAFNEDQENMECKG